MRRRSSRRNARQYPRTARLNTLLQQIVAEALEDVDDERLDLVTVTAVDVDADLNRAVVYYDSLQGADGDAEVLEAFDESRAGLRRTVAREARLKRVPELVFAPDPAVRAGTRIEATLAEIGPIRDDVPVPDQDEPPDPGLGPATDAPPPNLRRNPAPGPGDLRKDGEGEGS